MTITRLYHQVYFETDKNLRDPKILARILKTIFEYANVAEAEIRTNGTRLLTEMGTEIKIGYDPWIQVSAKNIKTASDLANRIIEAIEKGE